MLTFGAAISTASDHAQALDEVIPAALEQVGGPPDLVVCFFSMEHADAAGGIALSLSERTGTASILGCTAQGVIGGGRELEGVPGLAVWLARLPGVEVRPFGLRVLPLEDGVGIGGWPDLPDDDQASVLLLAEPFTFPADSFLERLNAEQPGLPVIGGMVSGATEPGRHRLLHGTEVLDGGAAGVALVGPVDLRAVVSQGCRPVGAPFAVTRGEGNVVHELGGQPAVSRLRQMLAGPETGSIAVADSVEIGQTLQFHVRDAASADEDLELLLVPVSRWRPRGVLLFSCNGRGRGFFGEPDHDAARVAAATAEAPMAGFFAQGELGPIGGRNFLHTFTASMAVFCEPRDPVPALDRAAEAIPEDLPGDLPGEMPVDEPPAPETPEPV